jgi:hypothetical protein
VHLYNFHNGRQEAVYLTPDGTVQRFDSFVVQQNGYARSPQTGTWVSWGWSYEFPIAIEGARRYTVEPYSRREFLELPELNFALYEGGGRLINDETNAPVGMAVNESADIRIMQNGPYGKNHRRRSDKSCSRPT